MKTFVVGVLSAFENDNKLFMTKAETPIEALHNVYKEFNKEVINEDYMADVIANLKDNVDDFLDDMVNQELFFTEPMEIN
jgi:hypothetical protein